MTEYRNKTRAVSLGSIVLGAALAAGVAAAGPAKQSATPEKKSVPTVKTVEARAAEVKLPEHAYALSDATMRVFLDPQTGRLREPSAAEMAELGRAAGRVRSAAEAVPQVFDLPGGGIGVEVPAELMSYSLVRIGEDGAAAFECHDSELDLESHSVAPVAPATAEVQ